MYCKYSEKENINELVDRHYLSCTLTNQRCAFVRYCGKVGDIINTDNCEKNCKTFLEKEANVGKTNITPNKVLFEKRGKLWVEESADQVVVVENPYDYVPKFVKLLKRQNGEYYIKVKK